MRSWSPYPHRMTHFYGQRYYLQLKETLDDDSLTADGSSEVASDTGVDEENTDESSSSSKKIPRLTKVMHRNWSSKLLHQLALTSIFHFAEESKFSIERSRRILTKHGNDTGKRRRASTHRKDSHRTKLATIHRGGAARTKAAAKPSSRCPVSHAKEERILRSSRNGTSVDWKKSRITSPCW